MSFCSLDAWPPNIHQHDLPGGIFVHAPMPRPPSWDESPYKKKISRNPPQCPPSMPQHTGQLLARGLGGYAHHHRLPKGDFRKGGSGARVAQSRARSRQRPRSVLRPGALPSSPGGAWVPPRESRVRHRHLWGETPDRSSQPLVSTVRCRPDSTLRFRGESPAVHDEPGGLQPPPALAPSPARSRAGWGREGGGA